jgi:hypothetical protein
MRRMRDSTAGRTIVFAVPALGAAFGITYLIRHHHSGPTSASTHVAQKSTTHAKGEGDAKSGRTPSSAMGDKDGERISRDRNHKNAEDSETEEWAGAGAWGEPKSQSRVPAETVHAVALEAAANDAAAVGKDCAPIEYRGEGPQLTRVTRADWAVVMDQFHGAKHQLLGWLETHRKELPEATASIMEVEIRNLKIQRPPVADEPDLAWRGIGVYGQSPEHEPMIKLGGGFVSLAVKHPARAKFEMARLVAQAWAPCELQHASASPEAWTPLLKCLSMSEKPGCENGSYSENAWAVSSTLAVSVSPPGCQVPAFRNPDFAKCLDKTAGRAVASVTSHEESHK